MSRAARRRAAERGDGWLALSTADTYNRSGLAEQLEEVREMRAAGPRADEPFRTTFVLAEWPDDRNELIARALEVVGLGFEEIILEPAWHDPDQCVATIAAVKEALDG
jgi:hypothetical protein